MMRYGSICSGIEAATVAWDNLGWTPAWFAEIEPFPSAVLSYHYPTVPNLGDITQLPNKIMRGEVEAPDVLVGGPPCQAFSVAGLQKSLEDSRGQLTLTYVHIINAIDRVRHCSGKLPTIAVYENVPGILNTKDNAFGCLLAGLAGEDVPLLPAGKKWTNAGCVYGPQRTVAWRVLDAQYFGVAQRRRRVFIVASARDGFDAARVLFEFSGVRRDFAPSRETKKEASDFVGRGAGSSNVSTHRMVAFGEYSADGTASAMKARDYKDATDLVAYGIPGNWVGRKPENGGNAVEPMHNVAPCQTKTDVHAVCHKSLVRRLTPTECERLQAFPDNYTNIPWRGKPKSPNRLRYKALGNSMCCNVMYWVGNQIVGYLEDL